MLPSVGWPRAAVHYGRRKLAMLGGSPRFLPPLQSIAATCRTCCRCLPPQAERLHDLARSGKPRIHNGQGRHEDTRGVFGKRHLAVNATVSVNLHVPRRLAPSHHGGCHRLYQEADLYLMAYGSEQIRGH